MNKVIYSKEYDYESLYDLQRDLCEAIDETFNPTMKDLPADEHGFILGTFKVTIEWSDDE